jgi:hypothetical protein
MLARLNLLTTYNQVQCNKKDKKAQFTEFALDHPLLELALSSKEANKGERW